jgi:adenine C2-methylase RlmN of 23S rRNA A2503 and tRNA A37
MKTLTSQLDDSVNFVTEVDNKQAIESRYVRRNRDYFICYLSSQTACRLGCRMCHLTATKQMIGRDVTEKEFYKQAITVLEHYNDEPSADIINFNFMARGEPFDSRVFTGYADRILINLAQQAIAYDLVPDFNISTILPEETTPRRLWKTFRTVSPNIYYSLYSVNPDFRSRWLPNAMNPKKALDILAEWQSHSHKIPRIHYAFIKNENDSQEDVFELCNILKASGLVVDFNIVRYNPFSKKHGEEGDYERACDIFRSEFPESKVKVIGRVGFDVAASCGMFVK